MSAEESKKVVQDEEAQHAIDALLSQDGRFKFATMEEKVMHYWKTIDAFQTSLKLSEGRPLYTFYDGPPFATGRPHYGHILAGTIKDTVTRYAHQTGHYVSRRFGWDCHGLPVEHEIDKKLGIKSRDDVMAMGIAAYNEECRGIVTRYTGEWEAVVNRLGRWIDFKNDYKTMEPWFMESVWWVFKTIFEKSLVYRSYKVMPYSTACNTPLSNFEAGLDYRDVTDPTVVVRFPLVDEPEVSLLAWTTTPWTLPSNLALCVNEKMEYVKIVDAASGKTFILAEARLVELYKKGEKAKGDKKKGFELLDKFKGGDLVGKKYSPLFPYFKHMESTAFRVVSDNYVTSESGTGIVHQAPAFGEDDYRVCAAHGIIDKKDEVPCPVDANGRFTEPVSDFIGQHVKQADPEICKALKAMDRLVKKATIKHPYPFCWRSGTPLIYKAVPSWFVEVTRIKDQLVENNKQTYWVPEFVGKARFHNWLEGARDWAISRNRYWGTPLPIWVSEDGEEVVVVGSIEELKELSGVEKIDDIHRHFIDDIEIPSKQGKGMLRRVDEVFDCWFESGSMPYAQLHYPFENKEVFENGFPADFIAEGLDQTRGWFYTLMVLSTALYGKPAFKNLIVNGLVKAEDGKKMSKSLKNYPDPQLVIDKHCADALRLYLINSPVVRAQELAFSEDGVGGIVKDVLLKWYNTMQFFAQSKQRLERQTGQPFFPSSEIAAASTNVMDTWIISTLQTLSQNVKREMEAYHLYKVVPNLLNFIEQITNWYVKLNRPRMKGQGNTQADWVASLCCLYEALFQFARLMAPLAPFFSEFAYQQLRPLHPDFQNTAVEPDAPGRSDSVHYIMLPQPDLSLIDAVIERRVARMQEIVELGRKTRDHSKLPLKFPSQTLVLVCSDPNFQDDVVAMEAFIKEELNVVAIQFDDDMDAWCSVSATTTKDGNKALGRKHGKQFKQVLNEVKGLSHAEVAAGQETGTVTLPCGVTVEFEHLEVLLKVKCDAERYGATINKNGKMFLALDLQQTTGSLQHRLTRELTSRVQKLRKNAGLQMSDTVELFVEEQSDAKAAAFVTEALKAHEAELTMKLNGGYMEPASQLSPYATIIAEDNFELPNPKVPDANVPETMRLRVVVAAPAVFGILETLKEACGGSAELAQHAAHTLAMYSFADMQAKQSVDLKLMADAKAPVIAFTAKRGVHYYVGSARSERQ